MTRDRRALECEWNGLTFDLIDTGGVDLADSGELARAVQSQAQMAIEDADLVVLVADARHVIPLVRQELAHRQATGTAPVLNPESAEEYASNAR